MRRISCVLPVFLAFAVPAHAELSETDASLLGLLRASPAFKNVLPKGHRVTAMERHGGVVAGQISWGPDPAKLELMPKGLKTERGVNCDRSRLRDFSGTLSQSYNEIYSFTTTVGSSLAQSVSVNASWPGGLVSAGYELTATLTTEMSEQKQSGETVSFSQQYNAVVSPRHYADAQLQILEQNIEGQPFWLDVEIVGDVTLTLRPVVTWLPRARAGEAALVVAGHEPTASGGERDLPVCRVQHGRTKHPGKIVAGKCNYGFAEKEYASRSYEVLSMPKGSYKWVPRREFEKDNSDSDVANGQTLAVIAGKERRSDRYDGQLLVCRAKYKGDWHPGKVVINDCMFGYGGKEIQRGTYEVLVERDSKDEKKTRVRLIDYLTREQLSFRVEGLFEGTKAVSSTIVVLDERPVDDGLCAGAGIPDREVARAAPQRDAEVTRAAIAPAKAPGTSRPADGNGRGRGFEIVTFAKDLPIDPTPTEPALEGRVFSTLDLRPGMNRVDYSIRTLRRTRPAMRGADVLMVQRALTSAGWPVLEDGIFGGYTARAVRLFQKAHGLSMDGIVGGRTEARLGL